MLRPLRLMRFLAIIAIIQRGAGGILRGRVVLFTIGSTILIIIIAGSRGLDAERDVGNIQHLRRRDLVGVRHDHDRRLRRPLPRHGDRAAWSRSVS